MKKFKVGDKVRIKKDLKPCNRYGCCYFSTYMKKYRGKTATIEECYRDLGGVYFRLDITSEPFCWSSSMLEKVEEKVHFKSLDQYFSGKLEIENGFVIKQEEKKEILDKAEKEYLENLLRPFKNKVETIRKRAYGNDTEYLTFKMKNDVDTFDLPMFKVNTMYKGMKRCKYYTLEELGLFESNKKQ